MNKLKSILTNVSYTIASNLLSLIVSTVITLFLPKILGVESYGYYQLYLFYVSYVGFLHFGWCDGVYLRYGGENYDDLDYPLFKGQYFSLLILESIISLVFLMFIIFSNITDITKIFVFIATILNIIILNLRTFCLYILQTTNRMRDYSYITILDRLIFVSIVIILLIINCKNVLIYISFDILSRFISLIVANYKIKEITSPFGWIKWSLYEDFENIKVGINLMLANIASILIIGTVRFGIQLGWDIGIFGKIGLTLNISNMLMVFINAISLAIFPLIKREKEERYSDIYIIIRTILMPAVIILLAVYYPLSIVLNYWLPDYRESVKYMAIIFPIVIFESKVSLLTNTYLKAMRKEKSILIVNVVTMTLSFILTFVTVKMVHSLTLTMFLIVFLLAFRSCFSEYFLSKILDIKVLKDIILEICIVAIFIYSNMKFSISVAIIVYILSVFIYLFIKRRALKVVKNIILNLEK